MSRIISAILLKEWLKLKWYFYSTLLINLGVCTKILLDIRQSLHAEHAEMIWYQAIHLHTVFYQDIRYILLATGLLLAAAQFIPEILGRRMRISLHLPISRNRLISWTIASGLLFFLLIGLIDYCFLFFSMSYYFPAALTATIFPTILPWVLAGITGYCGCSSVLLETVLRRRVFLTIIFAIIISVFYRGHGYSWLVPVLPLLILTLPLALLTVYESARRFQQGGA